MRQECGDKIVEIGWEMGQEMGVWRLDCEDHGSEFSGSGLFPIVLFSLCLTKYSLLGLFIDGLC